MPGVTVRSSTKNMSRSKRAAINKNNIRVDAAVNKELESCTFGKITKALGNKMFLAIKPNRAEHLCYIRGKMSRIDTGDIVLLNEREYESRANSNQAVYDIMAVFSAKDISRLIKSHQIPSWMGSRGDDTESDELNDLFDYDQIEEEGDDENVDKKDKKNYRKTNVGDEEIDIDAI